MPRHRARRKRRSSRLDPLSDPGLAHVRTEMSLHVLAYNMQRVMRILGIGPRLRALQT
jgi:hypothetical protein